MYLKKNIIYNKSATTFYSYYHLYTQSLYIYILYILKKKKHFYANKHVHRPFRVSEQPTATLLIRNRGTSIEALSGLIMTHHSFHSLREGTKKEQKIKSVWGWEREREGKREGAIYSLLNWYLVMASFSALKDSIYTLDYREEHKRGHTHAHGWLSVSECL